MPDQNQNTRPTGGGGPDSPSPGGGPSAPKVDRPNVDDLLKHDEGLFFALEASGEMKTLIGEAQIIQAVQHPPADSRAYLRGRSVLKFAKEMKTAQWDNLVFKVGDNMYRLDMSQAFPGMKLEQMVAAMDRSKTIQDLIRELDLKPV